MPLISLITFAAAGRRAGRRASCRAASPARSRSRRWSSPSSRSGLSLLLLIGFDPTKPAFQYQEVADWIPVFGIQYKVGVDGLSVLLVVLTTTLSWISILASFGPIKDRVKEYMISFLILEVGMIGVFVALDLFLFYIFWEVVLVPMYLIIGIWGGSNRIYATIKFVLYTLVGSLLMLVAILATALHLPGARPARGSAPSTSRRSSTSRRRPASASDLQIFAFLAFFLAFAIKVPMFPFHTWLPDAHVEAPTAGSVILAGDPAQARRLRLHPLRRAALPGRGPGLRAADHRAQPDRDHLRRDRGPGPARPARS